MGAINLRTKIPGPNSRVLLKRKQQVVSNGIAQAVPIFIKSAKGAVLTDVDGNRLLDFAGGIGATNSGHANPAIIRAAKQQLDRFFHTYVSIIGYEPYVALCEKLNRITPGKFPKKTALFNSGAEAIENAVKIARKVTGRPGVISFEYSFHGRTLLTLGMTSAVHPYKEGFGPFPTDLYKIEYPYLYRRPAGISEDAYIDQLLEHLEGEFFRSVVAPEQVACIVMELVAGEGGFIPAPKRYVRGLAEICRKHGIILIIDEVQTGFCRTGKLFASEHYGIAPDLLCTAKSIANGLPLSAVTGKKEIMDAVQEGGLGGTFGGNPVACAAALAAIRFMEQQKLWQRAAHIGKIVADRFETFHRAFGVVGDVRGLGAMQGLEMVKSKAGKVPDPLIAKAIVKTAYEHGLVLLKCGINGNILRTLMPLPITDAQLREGLDVLELALRRHA